MLTILGQIATPDGLVQHSDSLGNVVEVKWTTPLAFLSEQRADLPVYFDHDETWRLGRVRHLERSDRLGLMALATIDADVRDLLSDGSWYFSEQCTARGALHCAAIQMHELSLVRRTANKGTRPIVWAHGDIETGVGKPWTIPMSWRDTWDRAAKATAGSRYRAAPDHLDIVDLDMQAIEHAVAKAAASAPTRSRSVPDDPDRSYVRHGIGTVTSFT